MVKMNEYRGNLDWLFYRDYYRNKDMNTIIDFDGKVVKRKIIKDNNKKICNYKVDQEMLERRNADLISIFKQSFKFKTTYPGLLIGSGLSHGIGSDDEFKLGFQFDYTSGLPIIHGSSVKGLLRSAFPLKDERYKLEKKKYIEELLSDISDKKINSEVLEEEIFEGDDIFFSAQIVRGNKKGNILGEDYITPHEPLRDPKPIKFLKVLPNVLFEFRFALVDSEYLTGEQKAILFKTIILDLGIGAKTNVGYGNLVEI